MVTIYGGAAPAPSMPGLSLGGDSGYPREGRITIVLFFNGARDDDLSMVDTVISLREEFKEDVDLVGVHCPRFPAERDIRRMTALLECSGVDFPVYDDSSKSIRKSYLINGWPATVVVDPKGYLAWAKEGVIPPEILRPVIKTMQRTARVVGDIKPSEQQRFKGTELNMLPVRLALFGERLVILDGKSNRLIFLNLSQDGLSASIERSIGLGRPTLSDVTGFYCSQDRVFIFDRRGRKVRIIDLKGKELGTFSGNGNPALLAGPRSFGCPKGGVCKDGLLYVASAGTHQIWVQSLSGGGASPFAGTGRPGMDDGPPSLATLGSPEAIISDGRVLFISDSYSNSIRWIDTASGMVRTLVGEGPFLYGCRDGIGSKALFQRPMGLCINEGILYVADSYNDRIRGIDLSNRQAFTLYGSKKWQRLFCPSDVAVRGDRFYVADLGSGRIVHFDKKGGEPEILDIVGLN
ncbi:NHL repeat-containing thioredoxin family protein [Dethiosulfovibrio salsuginis]|uniref:NHL repeat-containing protein n=1 Tax=Dethiosulfovibrio salsuginis TaxID=561720 RepID=A0A1X7IXP0_9BACT|nr:thioredoxin-like domain-containing protein [Dethiosulfovibrio salsuginis]SMG19862.1 hypothetical protein SAMN06275492_10643 [Dethiosulfovibrio salsuginis]